MSRFSSHDSHRWVPKVPGVFSDGVPDPSWVGNSIAIPSGAGETSLKVMDVEEKLPPLEPDVPGVQCDLLDTTGGVSPLCDEFDARFVIDNDSKVVDEVWDNELCLVCLEVKCTCKKATSCPECSAARLDFCMCIDPTYRRLDGTLAPDEDESSLFCENCGDCIFLCLCTPLYDQNEVVADLGSRTPLSDSPSYKFDTTPKSYVRDTPPPSPPYTPTSPVYVSRQEEVENKKAAGIEYCPICFQEECVCKVPVTLTPAQFYEMKNRLHPKFVYGGVYAGDDSIGGLQFPVGPTTLAPSLGAPERTRWSQKKIAKSTGACRSWTRNGKCAWRNCLYVHEVVESPVVKPRVSGRELARRAKKQAKRRRERVNEEFCALRGLTDLPAPSVPIEMPPPVNPEWVDPYEEHKHVLFDGDEDKPLNAIFIPQHIVDEPDFEDKYFPKGVADMKKLFPEAEVKGEAKAELDVKAPEHVIDIDDKKLVVFHPNAGVVGPGNPGAPPAPNIPELIASMQSLNFQYEYPIVSADSLGARSCLMMCLPGEIWVRVTVRYLRHVIMPMADLRNDIGRKTELVHKERVVCWVHYEEVEIYRMCGRSIPVRNLTRISRDIPFWYDLYVQLVTPANYHLSQADSETWRALSSAERHTNTVNVSVYDDPAMITATKYLAYRTCQYVNSRF